MASALFVSDLHGRPERYRTLFAAIEKEIPSFVFLGGDLLPFRDEDAFIRDCLVVGFRNLREALRDRYPKVFLIPGNDDPGATVPSFVQGDSLGLWYYSHNRKLTTGQLVVYGYCCVPPTPFRLKDWERYDVSRYCEPGCISPEEGIRSVFAEESEVKWGTIERDLHTLTQGEDLRDAVFLFHAPPYDTCLDRAALDGKLVDHAPLDLHIGSIAIRRFIEGWQPLVSLHGHVHEAARLTGEWKTKIGRTVCLGAAHDGPELALVRFDVSAPDHATRELLSLSYSASGVYGQDR
ncbi:MAG: metallophosphoesterase family protein [Acidobacteriaceae bacterium]